MMMRTLMKIFLTLVFARLSSCSNHEEKNLPFPLKIETETACSDVIDRHSFDGDCCVLKDTGNGGCVLIVINGNCVVEGAQWSIDYTSTVKTDDCPGDEGIAGLPNYIRIDDNDQESGKDDNKSTNGKSGAWSFSLSCLLFPLAMAALL